MPTFKYEAMDAQGNEWKDVIEAPNEEEAQATIRAMGYFVTRLSVQKAKATTDGGRKKKKKTFFLCAPFRPHSRLYVRSRDPSWVASEREGAESCPHPEGRILK